MISVHRLLQASNPVKRWVVLTGMKVVGKYDMLHGLVANPQPNPSAWRAARSWKNCMRRRFRWQNGSSWNMWQSWIRSSRWSKAYDHTFGEF